MAETDAEVDTPGVPEENDTLVSTETGLRPIEEIQIGDYVWSEDTETGEKELKKVTGVSVTMTNTLVYVTTEDGTTISTTENHPFYVGGKGWCAAEELEAGDVCRTKEGQTEVVLNVVIERQEEPVKVYNLTIEDNHTYYVSVGEVLVHNECHTATYEHLDNKGEVINTGTVTSGGTTPGRSIKPVRGCQGSMQEFAKEFCVNILYFMEGEELPWVFPQ